MAAGGDDVRAVTPRGDADDAAVEVVRPLEDLATLVEEAGEPLPDVAEADEREIDQHARQCTSAAPLRGTDAPRYAVSAR